MGRRSDRGRLETDGALDGRRARQSHLVVRGYRHPSPTVNSTFLQPFVSYTTPDAWTFTLNSESTYDWHAKAWQVPVNAMVSKVVKIGPQRVSFAVGARYYAASPDPAAKGWGARFAVTFLFPK